MAVSIAAFAFTYGVSTPVYLVPTSVLGPTSGTYDAAPVSPVTDVELVTVSVAPPAGPTSTPKLSAAPMSTGPGPAQLAGIDAAFTVSFAFPNIPVAGSMTWIRMGPPTASAVASPLEPSALLMLATGVSIGGVLQVTNDVRFCFVPSVFVPMAINCCFNPRGIFASGGVTSMDTSVAAVTVKFVVPEIVPDAALIVVTPTATVVASPLGPVRLLKVAIDSCKELHVTDDVI